MTTMPRDTRIVTRQSLLIRLKDCEDDESWREFVAVYRRLIQHTARKAGLSETEADEALQETLIAVSRKIRDFKYDPALASFSTWLLTVTRSKIADQFRKRSRQPVASGLLRSSDTWTSVSDQVVDPSSLVVEEKWEEDWQQALLAAALELVKAKVSPRQMMIYEYQAGGKHSVKETCRDLGVSATVVYLARYHVRRQLEKEIERLRRRLR